MAKDYYVILGISRDASPRQVKGAYRRLAKELHPDHYGDDARPFQAVQEAYDVLGDAERRRRYDEQVRVRRTWRPPPAESLGTPRGGPEPEPLIPDGPRPGRGGGHPLRSMRPHRPTFEEPFEWMWRHFASLAPLRAETEEQLDVVVPLTPGQAARGGQLRMLVPARAPCPTCRGAGGFGAHVCWRCAGEGAITGELPLSVSFPAGLADAHEVEIPLRRFGAGDGRLRVRFQVR